MKWVICGTVLACAFGAGSAVPFPAEYRTWVVVKTKVVGPQSSFYKVDGGLHHFYANSQAIEGHRTGKFPDGAVLVDERLETRDDAGVTTEGALKSVAVMRKDSRQYSETGGWGYDYFLGESRTDGAPASVRASCFACHAKAKDSDSVYRWAMPGGAGL